MAEQPLILVIDDDPIMHRLLHAFLTRANYSVIETFRAAEGIELARTRRPDLILLDVLMPEMNGFEAISALKSNAETAEIPVIFLSAKADAADRVRGLELGGADAICKPVDRVELLARIHKQLEMKDREKALRQYAQNLEEMLQERTRQLIHADRLASLGTLSAGMAHEINNPTTFIIGNTKTLQTFWDKMAALLRNRSGLCDDTELAYILNEFPDLIQSIRNGAERIRIIVAGLKSFARRDSSAKGPLLVNDCIREALLLTHNRLRYWVKIETSLAGGLPRVNASFQHLVQVFVNLLVNAADAIGEEEGGLTVISRLSDDGMIEIMVKDTGKGMPREVLDRAFDPFFTTKPAGQGTGLGLAITHGIIADHGGTIRAESQPGQGATFFIRLPAEKTDA